MTEQPLVSVILPTRNRAGMIERAIRSVLDQTYKNLELIVVDDASSDDTDRLVASLSDSRLRYIRLDEPRGASAARNVGIAEARGPWLSFQDSDDFWYPDKLARQAAALEAASNKAGVCVCSIEYDLFGRVHTNVHGDGEIEREVAMRRIIEGAGYGTPTLLIKREVVDTVGGFDESLPRLQDYEFTLRISEFWNFVLMPDPLVHADVKEDSVSNSASNYIRALEVILDKHVDRFKLHRRGHSRLVFRAGKYLVRERRYRTALSYFVKAVRINLFNFRALAGIVLVISGAYPLFNRIKS